MRSRRWGTLAVALVVGCGGGVSEDVDSTVATIVPVRGAAQLGDGAAAVVARASAGDTVRTDADGLARLTLDQGPHLLLDRDTALELRADGAVTVARGRVFAELAEGEPLEVGTATGSLRASNASFSLRVDDDGAHVYIVRGEVSWTHDGHRGIVSAGEELVLGAEVTHAASTLWHDWTGGLARPGPVAGDGPAGVGALEARVPGEVGQARWPLVVRRLDVRVTIDRDLAITEVDQLFFNPASETVEGLYRIRVPEGAVLQRFSVDRDERLVDGYVRERQMAQQAYDRQVYRGSTEDPALLEWDAPGRYRARIYPIVAGETRRIVVRYAEWLRPPAGGTARLYRYPMGGGDRAPHIQELSIAVDVRDAGVERVRAGMGALVEHDAVRIRRSDFRPRSDFWLELVGAPADGPAQRAWSAPHRPPPRAPDASEVPNEADERDYFYLPLVLPTSLRTGEPDDALDLVILADVSAGTDRSRLELGRSVVESITAHLDADDRIAVVSSDLTIRSVVDGEAPALTAATPERVEQLLDGLARVPAGGATDLGQALATAAGLLDPARRGAVIYVGDGAPTVGELGADGLLAHLARLPDPARLYAVAVGTDANLDLLETLTRGGGLALRVEERAQAADAALEVLAHAERPVAHHVEVSLGDSIDNAFPRRPMDAVLGEVFPIVGRVRGELPTQATVTGTIDGRAFSETIALEPQRTEETTDLRLRWASERLRQLLLEGGGREEVAELGTRYGLITPFTSYYVPSRRELSQMGASALNWIDRPLLRVGAARRRGGLARTAASLALGPLALTGCRYSERDASADEQEVPEWLEEAEAERAAQADEGGSGRRHRSEEGEMGREQDSRTRNRYGIAGPVDEPQMAREQAREQAGAVGVLQGMTGGWNAPAAPGQAAPMDAPFDGDDAQGQDPMTALGALMGDEVGDNSGFGGLGLRGTGRGGGGAGEGTIGLGNLGTIGHGGGGGDGSGYGRGASGLRGRAGAVPTIRTGTAEVRGSLSAEVIRRVIRRHINEVRFCYEQELATRPDLEGRVLMSFIVSPTGAVQSASATHSTIDNARVEQCMAQAVRRWTFPAPDNGVVGVNYPFILSASDGGAPPSRSERRRLAREERARERAEAREESRTDVEAGGVRVVVTQIVGTTSAEDHARRVCSDAASLPLSDRQALWSERLAAEGSAAAWLRLYREAIRQCEARTWRERSTFLSRILARAGSVDAMTQVYSLLDDYSARVFVRGRILRRVRTPEELRTVRGAFGLGTGVDWELVEQVLGRAPNDAAKTRALRRLSMQHPDSFELKLRLLATLERTEHGAEARRLADRMRADPLADPGVRTAIGEMYLRMGREEDARRVFSEIVEFAPLDELARRRLGDLYRAHGWFEDAYRQYQTLTEIRPDDPTVMLLLAQAAAGAGRVDEALRLELRLMQTAQPGASEGVARTALLWSSVRFARLKQRAREAGDEARLETLVRRMRRGGVLREAGALRVTLVWSHPDAQLALWAAHPGLSPTRPPDLAPEYGIEAFHLEEQEAGRYRFEVRQSRGEDDLTEVDAQLVVVWNEGEEDERVQLVDLHFDREHAGYAWTLSGRALEESTPGGER